MPVELLSKEVGKYLDIPSMISMSLTCKDFLDIYQPQFQKIVHELDPYIVEGTVYDFLNITKVGLLEHIIYKIWRIIFQTTLKEMEYIYPYINKKTIIEAFYRVIPLDAVDNIKNHIKIFLTQSNVFILYRGVLYRNPYTSSFIELSESFETDINDMVDTILHEIASVDRIMERDSSSDSLTDNSDDIIEYFPYENITDAIESWIKYL